MVDNYVDYQIDHEKADPKYPYVPSRNEIRGYAS